MRYYSLVESGRFVDTRKEHVTIHTRRLPHWTAEGGIYFVTFRLWDSLPLEVLKHLKTVQDAGHRRQIAERELDTHFGECVLRRTEAAEIVLSAFRHFDGDRYVLDAACVMPNHVHVLFVPSDSHNPSSVVHSWKSFTSNRINQILGREGRLWEPESFDHLVRNGESYDRIVRYIADNPVNAGLKDWPWTYLAQRIHDRAL